MKSVGRAHLIIKTIKNILIVSTGVQHAEFGGIEITTAVDPIHGEKVSNFFIACAPGNVSISSAKRCISGGDAPKHAGNPQA